MRMGTTFSLFGLSVLILQGVAAKGWHDQAEYSCPSNIKNNCTTDESNGFDWSDLPEGTFDSYKSYNFHGWSCSRNTGKRSLKGRAFNDKFIEVDLSNSGFSNEISCDKSFSIGELDISADEEADIEFHYGMEDGSTCKQTKKCGVDGTTVTNDQCGGAKTVKVKLPSNSGKKSCKLGVHKVKFECGNITTSVPVPTTTILTVVSSTQANTTTTGGVKPTSSAEATTTAPGEMCTLSSNCAGKTCTMPVVCIRTTTSNPASETCTIPSGCTGKTCTMPASCTTTPSGSVTVTSSTSTAAASTSTTPSETYTIPSGCTGGACTIPAGCFSRTTTSTPTGETTSAGAPTTDEIKSTDVTSSVKVTTAPSEICTTPVGCLSSTTASVPMLEICTIFTGCPSTTASVPGSATCITPAGCTGKYCTMPTGFPPTTYFVGTVPTTVKIAATTTAISTPVTGVPGATSTISSKGFVDSITISSSGSSKVDATESIQPSSTTTAVPEVSMPATECPDTLLRCLKTWIFITSCTDTADPTCFCPKEKFVNKVLDCLSAWSVDDNEVANSVEYFLSLCSPYIGQNPAIFTAIPSTITFPALSPSVPAVTITQTITTVDPSIIISGSISRTVVSVTTSVATQIVTAADAILVYPTSAVPTTPAPATVNTIPTRAPELTNAPGVTTTPTVPTTLVTYPRSSANDTADSSPSVSTSVPGFQGSASGIVSGTVAAIVGALAVILLQLWSLM